MCLCVRHSSKQTINQAVCSLFGKSLIEKWLCVCHLNMHTTNQALRLFFTKVSCRKVLSLRVSFETNTPPGVVFGVD